MPKGHWPGRNWTPEQLAALDEMLDKGLPDEAIGKKLGRSAVAVQVRRKRMRMASRTARNYSCNKLGELLGVDPKCVTWWILQRWLRGRRGQRRGPNRQWYVTEDALLEFLEDPKHWHLWEPGRITDKDLREWALEQRRERFLTQAEVAARYFVVRATVAAWFDRGDLPFVRRGRGNRMVPESALRGWVPPGQRPKAGMGHKEWTEFEDAVLRKHRLEGETYSQIAARLGRRLTSVANRWHRIRVQDALGELEGVDVRQAVAS